MGAVSDRERGERHPGPGGSDSSSGRINRLAAALADRYRIERELGTGGMATVYLGDDLNHDRKVAVKVLEPELTAVLGGDRFIQEIKTTASLQHPHILPLFDSGTADGLYHRHHQPGRSVAANGSRGAMSGPQCTARWRRREMRMSNPCTRLSSLECTCEH